MFLKHCTDEQLVGHLDGELSRLAERTVKLHLNACYRCRGRLRELEAQALALADAVEQDDFPGPRRIADAIRRFSQWEQSLDARVQSPQFRRLPAPELRWAMAACAAAALVFAALALRPEAAEETPAQVLVRAQKAEEVFARSAFQQSIRLELEETKPREQSRVGRLEVWSADHGSSYASRWIQQDGSLRHALWRPESERAYVFDAATLPDVAKPFHRTGPASGLLDLIADGPGLQALEAGFARWLENRQWRPLSITSELARFASRDGVILKIEKIRSDEGRLIHRLTARRETERRTAEITVEIDSETLRPRLQTVRLVEGDRALVVRFITEQERSVGRLVNSVFEPNMPIEQPKRVPRPAESVVSEAITDLSDRPAGVESETAARETLVRYVLHRSRACLGEPIEIVLHDDTRIVVSGITSNPQRKEDLVRALSNLGSLPWLTVELQTVDEAVRAIDAAEAGYGEAASEEAAGGRSGRHLPLAEILMEHFRQDGARDSSEAAGRVRGFASEALSRSESVLAHSWALARLAERYAGGPLGELDPRSRWLVEIMIEEHIEAALGQAREARAALEPVLSAVAAATPMGPPPAAAGEVLAGELLWDKAALTLLGGVRRNHEHVLALFTVGYPMPLQSPSTEGANEPVRTKSPEETARDLLGYLHRLETDIRAVKAVVPAEFSAERIDNSAKVNNALTEANSREAVSQ